MGLILLCFSFCSKSFVNFEAHIPGSSVWLSAYCVQLQSHADAKFHSPEFSEWLYKVLSGNGIDYFAKYSLCWHMLLKLYHLTQKSYKYAYTANHSPEMWLTDVEVLRTSPIISDKVDIPFHSRVASDLVELTSAVIININLMSKYYKTFTRCLWSRSYPVPLVVPFMYSYLWFKIHV